jgi:hypothetical protein
VGNTIGFFQMMPMSQSQKYADEIGTVESGKMEPEMAMAHFFTQMEANTQDKLIQGRIDIF